MSSKKLQGLSWITNNKLCKNLPFHKYYTLDTALFVDVPNSTGCPIDVLKWVGAKSVAVPENLVSIPENH